MGLSASVFPSSSARGIPVACRSRRCPLGDYVVRPQVLPKEDGDEAGLALSWQRWPRCRRRRSWCSQAAWPWGSRRCESRRPCPRRYPLTAAGGDRA
jgi:hypothetical protein